MPEATVILTNKLGLHARAAAVLTKLAAKFQSKVFLRAKSKTVNARSVLHVMTLGLTMGEEITIEVVGTDELECLAALTELIKDKFYEE